MKDYVTRKNFLPARRNLLKVGALAGIGVAAISATKPRALANSDLGETTLPTDCVAYRWPALSAEPDMSYNFKSESEWLGVGARKIDVEKGGEHAIGYFGYVDFPSSECVCGFYTRHYLLLDWLSRTEKECGDEAAVFVRPKRKDFCATEILPTDYGFALGWGQRDDDPKDLFREELCFYSGSKKHTGGDYCYGKPAVCKNGSLGEQGDGIWGGGESAIKYAMSFDETPNQKEKHEFYKLAWNVSSLPFDKETDHGLESPLFRELIFLGNYLKGTGISVLDTNLDIKSDDCKPNNYPCVELEGSVVPEWNKAITPYIAVGAVAIALVSTALYNKKINADSKI